MASEPISLIWRLQGELLALSLVLAVPLLWKARGAVHRPAAKGLSLLIAARLAFPLELLSGGSFSATLAIADTIAAAAMIFTAARCKPLYPLAMAAAMLVAVLGHGLVAAGLLSPAFGYLVLVESGTVLPGIIFWLGLAFGGPAFAKPDRQPATQ